MGSIDEFPNERLRWMDDLLRELENFSQRYELTELEKGLSDVRETLVAEVVRINGDPEHPIHNVRGPLQN